MLSILHVGCGTAPLPALFARENWHEVRLDADPAVHPNYVASITALPLVDAAFDAVYCSHNLEHIESREVPIALREFWRVLRPGGTLHLRTPDIQRVCQAVVAGNLEGILYESPSGPICPIDILWGYRKCIDQGNKFYAHRTGFTAETLRAKLTEAGFSTVQVQSLPELWELVARATK